MRLPSPYQYTAADMPLLGRSPPCPVAISGRLKHNHGGLEGSVYEPETRDCYYCKTGEIEVVVFLSERVCFIVYLTSWCLYLFYARRLGITFISYAPDYSLSYTKLFHPRLRQASY